MTDWLNKLTVIKNKTSRLVAGIISGTSVDKISAALCKITGGGITKATKVELIKCISLPYQANTRKFLLSPLSLSTAQLSELNVIVGNEFALAFKDLCNESGINSAEIDLIGSHGQTIFHHSSSNCTVKSSLQIGDGNVIAERTGVSVVSDFRMRDIAAGGEGAPLTPYADAILYAKDDNINRAVLNLGGIANITFLSNNLAEITGFDCGPANAPLDRLARIISNGKLDFDKDGELAKKGTINNKLLQKLLLEDTYLEKLPPKSTGPESYGDAFIQNLIKLHGKADYDLIATVTHFCATTVVRSIKNFQVQPVKELIIAGGGAYNTYLTDCIATLAKPIKVKMSDELGIPIEAREAMAFAIFANDALLGIETSLPKVTGAKGGRVLGKWSMA